MTAGQPLPAFLRRRPAIDPRRKGFFDRVTAALGRPVLQSPATTPPANESLVRQVAADDPQRIGRFIEKAAANGMKVQRAPASPDAVAAAIDVCLADHRVRRCILNAGRLVEQFALASHLSNRNIAVVPWGSPACRDAAFDCDASITDCRAALADAGSLLVWSDASFGRSSTLVVPLHIVLLPASRILPDLIDGLALVRAQNPDQLPSNVVLINGPSKTADIEMHLITGVHGPKYVHVIVIEDRAGGSHA